MNLKLLLTVKATAAIAKLSKMQTKLFHSKSRLIICEHEDGDTFIKYVHILVMQLPSTSLSRYGNCEESLKPVQSSNAKRNKTSIWSQKCISVLGYCGGMAKNLATTDAYFQYILFSKNTNITETKVDC